MTHDFASAVCLAFFMQFKTSAEKKGLSSCLIQGQLDEAVKQPNLAASKPQRRLHDGF